MQTFGTILLVVVGLGTLWAVFVLARQGHPEDEVERDIPDDPGPTGHVYPAGSRPAGPGAERMIAAPSENQDDSK